MPIKNLTTLPGIVVSLLALSTAQAWAGFEWVAPSVSVNQQVTRQPLDPYTPSSQMATGAPEVISPVIVSGDGSSSRTAPATTDMRETPSLATATIPASPASGGSVVQGFASQVPLALALRQILPAGYTFSIDQNVDMDTLVSYRGGRGWRDTLNDMLVAAGLAARTQGSTVFVSRASAMPVTADAPLLQPAAPYPLPATPVHSLVSDVPAHNVGSGEGWSAERGDTLRKVLTDWCKRDNVELQWLAEYDYPMEASANFSGSFEDAVRLILAGFETARPQPVAELHKNTNAGQKVLVVQARGNSYSN